MKWLYSAFTIFGIIIIGAALAFQILYIKNNQNSTDYYPHQIAAVVMDTLVVCYLMAVLIYYRPYNSAVETGVVVSLLMIGLGLEIFSTQWNQTTGTMWGGYILASLNALLRLLVLVQTRCDVPLTSVSQVMDEIVKLSKTTGKPVADTARSAVAPLVTVAPENLYGRVNGLLDSILAKSTLTDEEKSAKRNQAREIFGKEPKGGRRR
jgi:hypothetical protein